MSIEHYMGFPSKHTFYDHRFKSSNHATSTYTYMISIIFCNSNNEIFILLKKKRHHRSVPLHVRTHQFRCSFLLHYLSRVLQNMFRLFLLLLLLVCKESSLIFLRRKNAHIYVENMPSGTKLNSRSFGTHKFYTNPLRS